MADNVIETGRSRIEDILLSASNGEPLSRIEEILLSLYQDLVHLDDQGLIPASLLPPQVFEHCEVVVDDTARFALTTDDVQNGDLVYVNSSQTMYFVLDDTKLDREAGYLPLAAGVAAKAIADELGNDIVQTYATKQELSGKQDTTLASWTPGSATTHSTPAVGDTITEALQKIDNNQRNDEGNISTLEQMNGAKNMLQYTLSDLKGLNPTLTWNDNVATISGGGCTFTVNSDLTIDVVATDSHTQANMTLPYYPTNKGDTVMLGCPSGGSSTTYKMGLIGFGYDTGRGIEVPNQSSNNRIFIEISTNKPLTGTYKPMVISKAAYNAGFTDYQPYALSNVELTEELKTKPDAIDSTHKLSADLVDDTSSTNKFTTAADKTKLGRIVMDSTESTTLYFQSTQPSNPQDGDIWIG